MQPEPSQLKAFLDGTAEYIIVLFLAVWGGTASYISRRKKDSFPFSLAELLGEWLISGFAGLMTVLICQEFGVSQVLTYAAAGVAGHMGGRSIAMIEAGFIRRFGGKR